MNKMERQGSLAHRADTLPLTMANYQILIVGAGLAGLHSAMRLSDKYPSIKIAIAEAYDYVGGRCFTYQYKKDIQWESGAGRIHSSHKLVNHYVTKYNLTKIPIDSQEDWVSSRTHAVTPNTWSNISEFIVTALSHLNSNLLATHTIEELLNKSYGETYTRQLLERFSYRSEVNTMRADLAIQSLQREMSSSSSKSQHFYVVKEGLSELARQMCKTLTERGVTFLLNHRLCAVEQHSSPIVCKFTKTRITADKVILALHSEALKKISPFSNLPVLKHLKMQPLLRTYGVFPTEDIGFNKMVTDSPLRFIIPVNSKKGVLMTSYTDGDDTKPWAKILKEKGEKSLKAAIMRELTSLFPTMPPPIFFKSHLWNKGCTYWTPGLYDPKELSEKVMKPLPSMWQNLYACGESFSLRQAWIEGALEHSDKMIDKFF